MYKEVVLNIQMCECSSLTADEAALKRLCWILSGLKNLSIDSKGGVFCLEPQSDELQLTKEDTIFVEAPPDTVSTLALLLRWRCATPSFPVLPSRCRRDTS